MFTHIGGKIKILAQVLCYIGIAASVFAGIAVITMSRMAAAAGTDTVATIAAGVIVMIAGSLLSWVGSFLLYGFGELVQNSSTIAELMTNADVKRKILQ